MAGNMRAGIRLEVDRTGNIRAFDMLRGDVRELNAEARRTNEQLRNMNRTAAQGAASFDQFRSAIGQTVMYAGIAAGVGAIAAAMSKVVEVGSTMQGLESSFTASFGSLKSAQSEIGYIKDLAGDLGLQFISLGKDYGQWSAAVAGTALAGEQSKTIFESMSQAAKVLNLSADDTSGALRAMAQMVSKGKVQAEELRGQLGERLPGAFQMAARAMGVTTAQLNKMLELGQVTAEDLLPKLAKEMQKTFGGSALEQAKTNFASNTNRMYNALNELANNIFMDVSPALSALASGVTVAAKHQDILYASALALATFLAARGVNALASYTAAKYSAVMAARVQAAADAQAAAAATAAATATATRATHETRLALLSREAAAATLTNARATLVAASANATTTAGLAAYQAALARVTAAQAAVRTSSQALAAARATETAATAAASAAATANATASGAMAVAGRGLASVMALLGGPVGVIMIAAAGLYYLKTAHDEARQSIELADGSHYSFAESLQYVNKISLEYRTASAERQTAIRAEIADIIALTNQRKIEAQEQLKYLAELDQQSADNGGFIGTSMVKWVSEVWNGDAEENKAIVAETTNTLKSLMPVYTNPGEPIAEATAGITALTGATNNQTKAAIEAGKAVHSHGDAIKALVENFTKQRIELEHGKLAAQYYTDRLNGLTDAEARAAAGANQYNTLLAERQKLNREASEMSGGLRTKYLNGLEDQGLSAGAMAGIDAAQSATDQAVAAAKKYQSAIDATTESLKQQAEAAKTAATGAVGSFAAQTASIQNISGAALTSAATVVAKLQQLGWTKNQAIGIAANIKQESEFNPSAIGDGGKAYGLAQWHPDRQASFKQTMGRDIRGSSAEAQVEFISKELFMANGGGAGKRIKSTDSAAEAAAIMSKYYERPKEEVAEMTRRAGIANGIAKSLGDTVPTFRTVATEAAKVAPAVAQAAPVLDAITAKTQTMADVTVEYGGTIDSARASQKDILDLADQYMSNQAQGLILSAADHQKQVALTGAEYRDWQLSQKEFNAGEKEKIILAEQLAAYADEAEKLEEEHGSIRASLADQYQQSLEKQNLTQQQIADLVSKKMAIGAEKLVYDAERNTAELQHTADEWRKIELSQDGYNTAQIASIVGAEELLERTKAIRDATDKIGDGMFDALTMMGNSGMIDGLKSTVENAFKDMVLTPTIKPITDAISVGMSNTISGQANPWAGLQQQYSAAMSSMQAGGWQGAATSAGIAGGIVGILGGSAGQSAGASIGAAAGNTLATMLSVSGPVGMALGATLGALAGGLFEDDDSARAKFTNGSPTDGFVNRDGNKLSATSVYGSFGFQEDGTHDLGNSAEKEMAAFVARMAEIDNALAAFIPASETSRIQSELSSFEHSGLDFAELFKQRLVIITTGLSDTMRGLIDYSQDADGILTRINDLIVIQREAVPALRNMNLNIGATDDAALAAAAGLADAAGGLQNLTSYSSAYYSAVYSEEEQKQKTLQNAQVELSAFNAELGRSGSAAIDTGEELKDYVQSLDLTTEAGQKAYTSAMQLVPALLSVSQAQEYMLDQTISLRNALKDLAAGDLSILTPVRKLEDVRKEFEDTLTSALNGDQSAINDLVSDGQALLQLSRAYNASGDSYTADYTRVTAALEKVATSIEDNLNAGLDGSHASGLSAVPFDGYKAELHKGEAVIDAATMSSLREYGIPVLPIPAMRGDDDVALLAEVQAMRREMISMTAEIIELRRDNNRYGSTAVMQRDQQTRVMHESNTQARDQYRSEKRLKRVEAYK